VTLQTESGHPAPASWSDARPPVALYIHVPFCLSLCPYCDFVVYTGRAARGAESRIPTFLAALHQELGLRADALDAHFGRRRPSLASVYLGGGTPSLLPAAEVARLLEHVDRRLGTAADAEITLEANPAPADRGDLQGFRRVGVTRVSLGAQSLDAAELRAIGRRHRPEDVRDALREARAAGFTDVSLDLLLDLPGQTERSWRSTLEQAVALDPDHLSTYALSLDDPEAEGLTGPTGDHLPLRAGARAWRGRARAAQDDDRAAALTRIADERLDAAGYHRYELSNRARPGHESRHNLAYWRRLPHEALGPGAHAFDGGSRRRWNAARLEGYMGALLPGTDRHPVLPPGGEERVDAATARSEEAILALRLSEGLPIGAAADPLLGPGVAWGIAARLIEERAGRLRLSDLGRLLANEVFQRLLPTAVAA
jgi:oxygen-independent coproporphyrinogen-3 oxidase